VRAGSSVACAWAANGSGASFVSWSATGFSPASPSGLTASFVAGSPAAEATILAQWLDEQGHPQSQTLSYSITDPSSPATGRWSGP
jgi:hypothetical protein